MPEFHNNSVPATAFPQTGKKHATVRLPEPVQNSISMLWQAHQYARDVGREIWEFAVEIANLRTVGAREADLRWLLCKQLVRHADEITLSGETGRQFRPIGELSFTDRTCFVLTPAGVELAETSFVGRGCAEIKPNGLFGLGPVARTDDGKNGSPCWDADRHELRLNGQIVKRFKHRSPNQEAILMAFQEEGWPARVDDPLPPTTDSEPKRRLNDTIKGLNHHQDNQLMRFRGDGTGEGILWELTSVIITK